MYAMMGLRFYPVSHISTPFNLYWHAFIHSSWTFCTFHQVAISLNQCFKCQLINLSVKGLFITMLLKLFSDCRGLHALTKNCWTNLENPCMWGCIGIYCWMHKALAELAIQSWKFKNPGPSWPFIWQKEEKLIEHVYPCILLQYSEQHEDCFEWMIFNMWQPLWSK